MLKFSKEPVNERILDVLATVESSLFAILNNKKEFKKLCSKLIEMRQPSVSQ